MKAINVLQNDINLILKLINNNKQYLKESVLKSDVFIKLSLLIKRMVLLFNNPALREFLEDDLNNSAYQRLLHDALFFTFSVVQLS